MQATAKSPRDVRLQAGLRNLAPRVCPSLSGLSSRRRTSVRLAQLNQYFSLAKITRIAEGKTLEFRVETFNTFNHFNPSNPDTSLTYNFTTGAQTNAAFGTIQSAQVDPRRAVLSARFKF